MRYYSTHSPSTFYTSATAVRRGIAPDGGLFIPEYYPTLPEALTADLPATDPLDLSEALLAPYFSDSLSASQIRGCIKNAISFPTPVVQLDDRLAVVELFHGPTCAFKDYGARTMAQIISQLREPSEKLTILVATSGDTGGAVAAGFHRVAGIEVVILYPSRRISEAQEKQLTTWGDNITALEVLGTFDDCQRLVKQAFLDRQLQEALTLTSANSINIARLLPQMLYYGYAMRQLTDTDRPAIITVPSGNLGNLTSGLIARAMGLPIHRFCCASNANKSAVEYLQGNLFQPSPTTATVSNAMDVGDPSNFPRMLIAQANRSADIRSIVSGITISDTDTLEAIATTKRRFGYLADPHTAVGIAAAEIQRQRYPDAQHLVLSTAHPAKFADIIERAGEESPEIPPQLAEILTREKHAEKIEPALDELRKVLLRAK